MRAGPIRAVKYANMVSNRAHLVLLLRKYACFYCTPNIIGWLANRIICITNTAQFAVQTISWWQFVDIVFLHTQTSRGSYQVCSNWSAIFFFFLLKTAHWMSSLWQTRACTVIIGGLAVHSAFRFRYNLFIFCLFFTQ